MNAMKFILLTLSAATIIAGCGSPSSRDANRSPAAPTNAPDTAPVKVSEEGGITSGGGGTLNAQPIAAFRFYEVVDDMKGELRMYILEKQKRARQQDAFFIGEKNLLTVLEDTDLEILNDRACKDRAGQDVDASIVASKPNAICLSAFRMIPKLIEERAHVEIGGLILHELSHLLGANEEQAKGIQWDLAYSLQSLKHREIASLRRTYPVWVRELKSNLDNILKNPIWKSKHPKPEEIKALHEKIGKLLEWYHMVEFYPEEGRFHLSALKLREAKLMRTHAVRVQLAKTYLETLYPSEIQRKAVEFYKTAFGQKDAVTLAEFSVALPEAWGGPSVHLPNEKVQRAKSVHDVYPVFQQLGPFLDELYEVANALAEGSRRPDIGGPWDQDVVNPWSLFEGKYTASQPKLSEVNSGPNHECLVFTDLEIKKMSGEDHAFVFLGRTEKALATISLNPKVDPGVNVVRTLDGGASVTNYQGNSWPGFKSPLESRQTLKMWRQEGNLRLIQRFETAKTTEKTLNTDAFECEYELRKLP